MMSKGKIRQKRLAPWAEKFHPKLRNAMLAVRFHPRLRSRHPLQMPLAQRLPWMRQTKLSLRRDARRHMTAIAKAINDEGALPHEFAPARLRH